jgi:chemotaxis protein CheC
MMSVPKLNVIDVSSKATILGGPENELVGILVNMTVNGRHAMFLLGKEFVCLLVKCAADEENISDYNDISEMNLSAIMEIGNILAGSYVSAISTMTNLDIRLSTPQIAIDMAGAILSYPAAQFGTMGDKLLFIEENFMSGEKNIKSHLLIMPEIKSLENILRSLEIQAE